MFKVRRDALGARSAALNSANVLMNIEMKRHG